MAAALHSSVCVCRHFFSAHLLCVSSLQATLTSYSENVERTKYGGESSKEMGSGGNLKPWQSQKSSMDSCLYRVDENMTASTYSLNKIPERNLETVLSQSVQSIPLYLMPRPNSVAGKSVMVLPSGWVVVQGAVLPCHCPCRVLLISFLYSSSFSGTKAVFSHAIVLLKGKLWWEELFLLFYNGCFGCL